MAEQADNARNAHLVLTSTPQLLLDTQLSATASSMAPLSEQCSLSDAGAAVLALQLQALDVLDKQRPSLPPASCNGPEGMVGLKACDSTRSEGAPCKGHAEGLEANEHCAAMTVLRCASILLKDPVWAVRTASQDQLIQLARIEI